MTIEALQYQDWSGGVKAERFKIFADFLRVDSLLEGVVGDDTWRVMQRSLCGP